MKIRKTGASVMYKFDGFSSSHIEIQRQEEPLQGALEEIVRHNAGFTRVLTGWVPYSKFIFREEYKIGTKVDIYA